MVSTIKLYAFSAVKVIEAFQNRHHHLLLLVPGAVGLYRWRSSHLKLAYGNDTPPQFIYHLIFRSLAQSLSSQTELSIGNWVDTCLCTMSTVATVGWLNCQTIPKSGPVIHWLLGNVCGRLKGMCTTATLILKEFTPGFSSRKRIINTIPATTTTIATGTSGS